VNKSLRQKLESTFKDIQISILDENRMAVTAESDTTLAILRFLKDAGFDHLALLSAVDWIEENEFELVYILTPYMQSNEEYTDREKIHLIVKTRIPREKPRSKTVIGIFPNAEPYEREIHELFGIKFEGHKRLTPLLLERDYEVPPFRKDFDTRKYVEDVFDKIPSVENKGK
jgi:NADH-quinone oxidoreductase subunit C